MIQTLYCTSHFCRWRTKSPNLEGELADLVGELDYIVPISAAKVPGLEVKLVVHLAS